MPIYQAVCRPCDIRVEYFRSISDHGDTPYCGKCGKQTAQGIFTAPLGFVKGEIAPFKSHVDGSTITNQKELEAHNKRNNVVCMSDGFSEEKIKAGDFGIKEVTLDKDERKQDIYDSIMAVKEGYVPNIEVQDE